MHTLVFMLIGEYVILHGRALDMISTEAGRESQQAAVQCILFPQTVY